jgi:energy-converting hydrogenase Eha subunit A
MMDVLGGLLKSAAPALATAVAGPLGGVAIKAIAGKLGVEDSVEAVTQHLQANPMDAAKLAEIDVKKLEMELKDRQDARNREIQLATNDSVPFINKIVTPVLALGVVALSFILFAVLIFVNVTPEAKDILIYILGVLSAAVTQILSYYFGSSQGSKDKSNEIKALAK